MAKAIYLDNHATTPVDPTVMQAMIPYFCEKFGNVASSHCFGQEVSGAINEARRQVARLIGTEGKRIVFTSGATESNNLAIKGAAQALAAQGRHIITASTEHKSVLDSVLSLEALGFVVTILPVDKFGCIQLSQLDAAIRKGEIGTTNRTSLISIMAANNEVGTIHPIKDFVEIAHRHGVIMHVDGAQACGKYPINVMEWGVDLFSLTAHKMYGPKGIGALYVSQELAARGIPQKQMHGGGQEFGFRSGTLPVPLAIGLGKAAELVGSNLIAEMERVRVLRDQLIEGLNRNIGEFQINGHPEQRLCGNLHISLSGIDGDMLHSCVSEIAVSSTSACSSAQTSASHVLTAMGVDEDLARSSLRIGIGRMNGSADIECAIACISAAVRKLRGKRGSFTAAVKSSAMGL